MNTYNNTSYKRLMEKGVLRCGYTRWPTLLDVDGNTGTISGVFYDYLKELGRILDIRIQWTEEMAFGQMPDALNESRIDAHCSGAWTNPIRGKLADNVIPIAYEQINAFVRADDFRFDNQLEDINSANIVVSIIEGESSEPIFLASYPRAKALRNHQATESFQMLEDVVTKKADVAFTDPLTFQRFIERNPNKIRQVISKFPIQVYGSPIWVKKGEVELKNTLNVATMQLVNDGTIERILLKHEKVRGTFLRPNPSYLSVIGG